MSASARLQGVLLMLRLRRLATTAVVAAAASFAAAAPAVGEDPGPILTLPAGDACEDFSVEVFATGGKNHTREFTDKSGSIRTITAGTGFQLTFVNADTRDAVRLKSNGAVTRTTTHGDGSQSLVSTGHNVIILSPSDIPAGPSMTLIVGRAEYTIDPTGIWTLQEPTGRTVDLCAELAS